MHGRPQRDEAAEYYFRYIDQVAGDDPLAVIEAQLDETAKFYADISEEKSLSRYAPDKWSIRQVVSHFVDAERVFAYRALWFARGFDTALPSFDQNVATLGAEADRISLKEHMEEFRRVRLASISMYRNLPEAAWMRKGIASDNPVTVRALAFIMAGHVAHHNRVVREKYF
jgi:hypothetical protein